MAITVSINLEARDNASRVFENMTGKIRDGVLQANLLGSAFNAIGNIGSAAFASISRAFNENAELNNKMVGLQDTLSKYSNQSLEVTEELNRRLMEQSELWGGTLIGSAKDYQSVILGIGDDIGDDLQHSRQPDHGGQDRDS